MINTLGTARERTRFDANLAPHHHFVCIQCGLTRDFYCQEWGGLDLPSAVEDIGQVEETQVEVRGICKKCVGQDSGPVRP